MLINKQKNLALWQLEKYLECAKIALRMNLDASWFLQEIEILKKEIKNYE